MYSDGTIWSAPVRRAFCYFGDYEIHFRHAGTDDLPVVLCLHPSPASSLGIAPIISELGRYFRVIAPDTLGNGDSRGPIPETPDIGFYADVMAEFLLEQGISRCSVYGCHTGAAIGMVLASDKRITVDRMILDGVGLYSPEFQEKLIANYIPDLRLDRNGEYALRLWQMLRDMYLFWPWFETKASNRRPVDLPSPEVMHARYLETLKAVNTFGNSYLAAFRFDKRRALSALTMPVMITSAEGDMLSGADQEVLERLVHGIHRQNYGFADRDGARRSGELFRDFLQGDDEAEISERPGSNQR